MQRRGFYLTNELAIFSVVGSWNAMFFLKFLENCLLMKLVMAIRQVLTTGPDYETLKFQEMKRAGKGNSSELTMSRILAKKPPKAGLTA
jgi:hypothetical protein